MFQLLVGAAVILGGFATAGIFLLGLLHRLEKPHKN